MYLSIHIFILRVKAELWLPWLLTADENTVNSKINATMERKPALLQFQTFLNKIMNLMYWFLFVSLFSCHSQWRPVQSWVMDDKLSHWVTKVKGMLVITLTSRYLAFPHHFDLNEHKQKDLHKREHSYNRNSEGKLRSQNEVHLLKYRKTRILMMNTCVCYKCINK